MPIHSNVPARTRSSASGSGAGGKLVALLVAGVALGAANAQEGSGRVYVRRIELEGLGATADRAVRDELVQLEGTILQTPALDASLRRLRNLPFVDDVNARLRPVEGTHDVVDVVLEFDERLKTRRYGGGGGWSESQRGSLRAYFADDNLLGTGQRLSFAAGGSSLRSSVDVTHTTPHVGGGEIARTIELSSRRVERLTEDASLVDAKLTSATVEHAYPLGRASGTSQATIAAGRRLLGGDRLLPAPEIRERLSTAAAVLDALRTTACCGSLRLGVALRRVELDPGTLVSRQLLDWIAALGDAAPIDAPDVSSSPGATLDELAFTLTYRRDTRDRLLFPSSGVEQQVAFTASVPGSDAEYALAEYRVSAYRPMGKRFTLRAAGRLAYGRAYGDTSTMPPYLHWFAGGPQTVRGFRENALGPRDSLGNPYGGNLLVTARVELMTPWPGRFGERIRVGLFADAGNVFSTEDVAFADADGRPLDFGFDASKLRTSAGIAADVLTPFGALKLSYAFPLDADDANSNPFLRDRIERFQITLGVEF